MLDNQNPQSKKPYSRKIEFHKFKSFINDDSHSKRLQRQYLSTLRDKDTLLALGLTDYIENEKTDEEILNYWKRLPYDDLFFVVYDKTEDDTVGTCKLMRIDKEKKKCELGYLVFINKRSTGYGTAILKKAIEYAHQTLGLHELYATTYESNPASCKAFTRAGFIKTKSENGYAYFSHFSTSSLN